MAWGLNGCADLDPISIGDFRISNAWWTAHPEDRDRECGCIIFQSKEIGPVTLLAVWQCVGIEWVHVARDPLHEHVSQMVRRGRIEYLLDCRRFLCPRSYRMARLIIDQ